MTQRLKKVWEKRSRLFGDSPRAVLEQSFPTVVLDYLHRLHVREVLQIIPNKKSLCLDIGCGYGRIALEVSKHRNVFIYGIDISNTFVDFYNNKIGKHGHATVSDIRKIPYKSETFDCVWIVTTLMYLETQADKKRALNEVFRLLRKGGHILIIEPNKLGTKIVRIGGLIPYFFRQIIGVKKVETYGGAFEWNEIDTIVDTMGGRIVRKSGYPLFTLSLLPCIGIGFIYKGIIKVFYDFVSRFDKRFPFSRFSYMITYEIVKK